MSIVHKVSSDYPNDLREIMREAKARRAYDRLVNDAHGVLKQHLHRAEKLGLPATLTVEQWQSAMQHFQGKCAYCQEKPCEVLEHFIPLGLGGGTTVDNCIPACRSCNIAKGPWHPYNLPFYLSPGTQKVIGGLERVQHYLDSVRSEDAS